MTVDHPPTPAPSSYDAGNAGSRSRVTVPPGEAVSAPRPPVPTRRALFDPWNSSSTGHQRAENRLAGSTSWRLSRNLKLGDQFRAGLHGSSSNNNSANPAGLRSGGQKSLADLWGTRKLTNECEKPSEDKDDNGHVRAQGTQPDAHSQTTDCEDASTSLDKQLFAGLCFYLNGSTAPLVSDHKLKQILATHGATHSITLGRRTVTHVVLGTVNARGGAGGSLAATKIQKEITKTGGKAVKFITADWILDSIKTNRRLPESRYSPLRLAPKSQSSVLDTMCAITPK